MKSLLLKDILVMRQYARTFLLSILIFTSISLFQGNNIGFSAMVVVLFGMLVITSFSYDGLAKWDAFALTMPIPARLLVAEKYVLGVLSVIAGTAFSILLSTLASTIHQMLDFKAGSVAVLVVGLVMLLNLAFLFPLVYRFGVEKARIFLIALLMLPTLAIVLIDQLNIAPYLKGFISFAELRAPFIVAAALILLAALYFLSYRLSTHIYESQEH